MPLGTVKIEVKADIGEGKSLPHKGKEIFIPAGKSVVLGRTGIEFEMKEGLERGVFRFCALPKNELIVRKEVQLGGSAKCDLHPYWFTLSVKRAAAFFRAMQAP